MALRALGGSEPKSLDREVLIPMPDRINRNVCIGAAARDTTTGVMLHQTSDLSRVAEQLTMEQSVGSVPDRPRWLIFWKMGRGTKGSFATTMPSYLRKKRTRTV